MNKDAKFIDKKYIKWFADNEIPYNFFNISEYSIK